jgi:hypothetical protein
MPSRHVMKSVLSGFLGTYTSRYSDYQGYWLLGLAESDLPKLSIDLLSEATSKGDKSTVLWLLRSLAVRRFGEQFAKAGFVLEAIREARLSVRVSHQVAKGWQGDSISDGHQYEFTVRAVMDNGRVFEATREVFVAPHDPAKERRRNPDS